MRSIQNMRVKLKDYSSAKSSRGMNNFELCCLYKEIPQHILVSCDTGEINIVFVVVG